jgi:hypothetical protein
MFHNHTTHFRRVRALLCAILISCFVFALGGCGSSSSDASKPAPITDSGDGGSYAAWVLEKLLSAAGKYVAGKSLGWILSLVEGGTSGDAAAFTNMQNDLSQIITDLETIETELEDVLNLINLTADEIMAQGAYLEIKPALDLIKTDYSNLQAFTKDMIGTTQGQQQAAQQADAYINSDNMEYQIEQIYTAIMGTTPGITGGVLDQSTNLILDQETGIDPTQMYNAYLSLETIFTQLVEYQLQAAAMEVEGLHWRDNPWSAASAQANSARPRSAVGSEYPGSAEEFMTEWFQPRLEDEVEEFLRCVDRIVCSQADLRTDIVTLSQTVSYFLPPNVDQVYFRADFIAAQFSSRHQFGLNVRLVGEPSEIKWISQGQAQVQDQDGPGGTPRDMTLVPLGHVTSGGGGDFPGCPLRHNAVEKWWDWPEGFDQHYAEWIWETYSQPDNPHVPQMVSGHIQFGYADSIYVAKYNDPDAVSSYGLMVKTTYPNEAAAFDGAGGIPMPNWYDDAMNRVEAGTAGAHEYGHVTLAIRHRPDIYYYYRQSATSSDSSMFTLSVSHGDLDPLPEPFPITVPPWFAASGALVDNPPDDQGNFNVQSGIAVPIINGTSGQQKLSVDGNLQGNYEQDITWIRGTHTRAYAYWSSDSGDEGDSWDLDEDTTNHSYGHCGASHDFDSNECCPFHMMVELDVVVDGAWGGQGDSAKLWPESMFLYF